MKENKNFLLVGILIAIMLVGIVSAQTQTEFQSSEGDNFIGRIISYIKYNIFQIGTFTVFGDTLGCSKYPNSIQLAKNPIFHSGQSVISFRVDEGTAFVNWFRGSPNDETYENHLTDSRQFLGEEFIKTGETISFTCDAGAYWNYDCYGEIYYCPNPCYSDSDCSSGSCDKSVLSSKVPDAGVCKITTEQHKTKVYKCDNGQKTYLGEVIYGDLNFCSSSLDSKYLIGTTDQCLPSEPSICNTPVTTENTVTENITKSLSLTEDEFNQASPKVIVAAMCLTGSDCAIRENYSTSCIFSNDIKNTDKNAVSLLSQSEGGLTSVCFGLSDTLFGFPAKILFGKDFGCINLDYKDPLISGTCRATETGGACSFLSKLSFFNITGNKCSDGGIILIGGIVLIFFLISMVGGKK